jgi:glyoxylase-like metal-dependent hydrolase (beta-lactamase superfamily II)
VLHQVADGVWVRQSAWVWSNAIAVRGEGGLILVDPGIDGSDLNELVDDLGRLGIPVVAGFSTHPTGTTCSGTQASATCRATPPPPAPTLPVKPESERRQWRRRARRASLSS